MKEQLPPRIRHKLAFRAWRACGRKVTAEVLAAGKCSQRHTVYQWAKDEGWAEAADMLDSQVAGAVLEEELSREMRLQRAKDEAQDELIEELAEQRKMLKMRRIHVMAKLVTGCDVDPGEIKEVTGGLLDNVRAASALGHNWENPAKVDLNTTNVDPPVASIEQAARDQVAALLAQQGISITTDKGAQA